MSSGKKLKNSSEKTARKDRVAEIVNIFEWLITGFILALLFMTFVMQAFRIPTGSMADTLKGAHFRLCCPQCGYKYDYGLGNYRLSRGTIPRGYLKPRLSRCPNCGYLQPTGGAMPKANGDRILVLKCIYQFREPKRWDVIVFKNPLDPAINYIKRLVGRPGETVEIIDGDIYINGQIARKPPKVQDELWMPVYDNDYQPVRPEEPAFNRHPWQQPFQNDASSKWTIPENNPTKFSLDSPAEQINTMSYDSSIGNDFRATYAYDDVGGYNYMPYCSDLMVRFYAKRIESQGCIGIALSKYQNHYKAWVDSFGDMVIAETSKGQERILDSKLIEPPAANKPTLVKFANVDHQLIFQVGDEKLMYDLGRSPDATGKRRTDVQPQVKIFGSGKLTLSHIAIFRDIHYTAKAPRTGKPFEFKLEKDEFFVLGDNSPNSADSRMWAKKGIGINGKLLYREGIVPRNYLVGEALFVYWPSGFRPFAKSRFAVIPNVGRMRFIYGGSSKNP